MTDLSVMIGRCPLNSLHEKPVHIRQMLGILISGTQRLKQLKDIKEK